MQVEMFQIILLTVAASVLVTSEVVNDVHKIQIATPQITPNPSHTVYYSKETVDLKCEVPNAASDLQYEWFKDSAVLESKHDKITVDTGGTYECRAKNEASLSEKSKSYVLTLQEPPKPKLTADPNWTEFFPNEMITLSCEIDDSFKGWSVEWIKNGETLKTITTLSFTAKTSDSTSDFGQYKCKGKLDGRSVNTQPSDEFQLNVRNQLPKPSLTLEPNVQVIYTGETLTLNCEFEVQSSEWEYLFFKDSSQINKDTSKPSFTITSEKKSNSGNYMCQTRRRALISGKSNAHTVTIEDIPSVQVTSEGKDAFSGERVSLQCVIGVELKNWNFKWFRNDDIVSGDPDTNMYDNILLLSVKTSHAGSYKYVCQVELKTRSVKSAKSAPHLVKFYGSPPTVILKQHPEYSEIYTGEKVQLTCSIQEETSQWEYKWSLPKSVQHNSGDETYTIPSATLSHNGLYACEISRRGTTFSSKSKTLTIIEPPEPKLSIQSQWKEFYLKEKVTLNCSINNNSKDWSYEWYKNGNILSQKNEISLSENLLSINSAKTDDSGSYKCRAKHQRLPVTTRQTDDLQLQIHGDTPNLKITTYPSFEFFYTAEQVLLTCHMPGVGWKYDWYKDSKPDEPSSANTNYTINSASLHHNGNYNCKAKRGDFTIQSDTLKVKVKEPPQPQLSIESQWKTFYPKEKVTLKCSIDENPNDWHYEWYRNETELSKEKDASLNNNIFLINSAEPSDSGSYKCKAKHLQRTSVTTNETKALQIQIIYTTPQPKIRQHPNFTSFYVDEKIGFDCNMAGVGWEYHWYKDSEPTGTCSANYTINSASLHHTGEYYCKAKRGDFTIHSETLIVQVEALSSATLTLITKLSDIVAGTTLTLRCEVFNEKTEWNYTWFENKNELNESSNTLTVMATKETIETEFKCRGKRAIRPLYTTWSDVFVVGNIVFKRKIVLAFSGCFICCVIILIIGCIVLKKTRKPKKTQMVHEDLFISKNQTTSPLMEYMDNKPPEKESEKQEELQLDRISVTHVDGVIKGEDSPAAESNGLMSFRGS